ncbi:NUDIX domain-containing protein, partial [Burkholderia ubonensis]
GGGGPVPLAPLTHTFTHFKLEIEPRLSEMGEHGGSDVVAQDAQTAWVPLSGLDAYGVPAPVRKLLDALSGPLL